MHIDLEIEKQLISDIKKDPSRFGIIFDAYFSAIFNYVYHRVSDYALTSDIVSETFLKAFLNIHKYKWQGISVSYWIYRIAANEIRQYYRKKKYYPKSMELLIDSSGWEMLNNQSAKDEIESLDMELELNLEVKRIQKNIQKLPIIYQEVLILRYFE